MKHVAAGKALPPGYGSLPGPSTARSAALDKAGVAAVVGVVDDIQRRFLAVKSVSGSPLRDDLDVCLAELDVLIPMLQASSPVLDYLQFEMEVHRLLLVNAVLSGYEV